MKNWAMFDLSPSSRGVSKSLIIIGLSGFLALSACSMRSLPGSSDALSDNFGGPDAIPDENGIITRGEVKYIMARTGDDMASIAQRAGVTAASLSAYNGLPTDYKPRAGEVLALPPKPVVEKPVEIEKPGDSDIETTKLDSDDLTTPTSHTVIAGETIFEVARLYNVPVADLARANGLGGDLTISPGQVLSIPVQTASLETKPTMSDASAETKTETASLDKDDPPSASSSKSFQAPVSGSVSQGFNPASDADGYVYSTASQAPVRAASDGEVVLINESTGDQGTVVMIRHPDGLISIYGQMSNLKVTKGQKVSKGQNIGTTESGELMFQIRQGTSPVDPGKYI